MFYYYGAKKYMQDIQQLESELMKSEFWFLVELSLL